MTSPTKRVRRVKTAEDVFKEWLRTYAKKGTRVECFAAPNAFVCSLPTKKRGAIKSVKK